MELAKATLCEISADAACSHVGEPVAVQFNPTSLRVSISNKSAGGQQAGSQARQRPGTGDMQVSFDLVFDTADLGDTENPVPVTDRTVEVEKYVRPRGNTAAQQTPPRVEFAWGSFLVQGVMESANIELDLFSHNGTPLRAKVAVSIKGQDPRYQYNPSPAPAPSPAAAAGGGDLPAGVAPGTPGTRGNRDSGEDTGRVAQAMPGESLQQLAARNGLDPAAWRALAAEVANPLSLPAGFEIGLPATPPSGAGNAGQGAAQDPRRTAAALPLTATPAAAADPEAAAAPRAAGSSAQARSAGDAHGAGLALTRQGGIKGAIASQRGGSQQAAADASRQAFGLPAAALPDPQPSSRPYAGSVPLRPSYGDADDRLPLSVDPTRPGWEAVAPREGGGARALGQQRPADSCRCDCGPGKRR
ncbi:CIS tube protein [Chitinimonas koreensis]|uniref:CIS tube protein n=1 Tax=Chitinimonas koreensis TaxID=356302 RepID=UPI0003F87626|nr:hypothetical protein [Chitinimonas koreensis]QNM98656.1 hypothetical protein H9L41_10795 [Chitinimonas koreensis]